MKPVPRWFSGLCWGMAVLFSVCVGLQYNDPDAVLWMAVYGSAAIAAALLPGNRIFAATALLVGLGAGGWAVYLGSRVHDGVAPSDLWMKMNEKGGAVEVGREAAGLALIAVGLLAAAVFRWTRA